METLYIFVMTAIYKIMTLISGVIFAYLGFRLFMADKTSDAGDLSVKYDKYMLNLKGGAPGVFFSLFGAMMIIISVIIGLKYDKDEKGIKQDVETTKSSSWVLPEKPL